MIDKRSYRLTFTEPLLGSQPMQREIFTEFQMTKAPTAEQQLEELESMSFEEFCAKGRTGFAKEDNKPFLWDYQVKGFLKEAGNVMKDIIGIKTLRSKIDSYVFVFPRKIFLSKPVSGVFERPIRVNTMQGPRVALVSSEVVDPGATVDIAIGMLPHKEINFMVIESLLEYGELKGIGVWRNGSFGRFTATAV